MTITEWLRNKILRFLKIEELSDNPNSERLTFINNNEEIRQSYVRECKVWYVGMASELLNYYTNRQNVGNVKNAIYNRNERNYFWGLSSQECNIKRVHTGLPNSIITTLVNAIGTPNIEIANEVVNDKLQHILEANDFKNKLNQEQMPLTMVEGDGAWKINLDKAFSDTPILQFYESENVEFIEKYGKVIGVVFKDYYKDDKGKDYVKFETRRISAEGDSVIEHDLFKLAKNNELQPVPLNTLPELADLETLIIKGLNKVLAVPCRFFFDPVYKTRGKPIYLGKVDLFDMADEIYSQLSQTNRVSTPVEYYNIDVLSRTQNGQPILPNKYNRQFVAKSGIPNGDGITGGKDIETTQPALNFDQYITAYKAVLDAILTGILSPSTMGIDVAKRDNADAQREKEKITIMTRNNIIERETAICKELCNLLLMLQEYLDTGVITLTDYDVSVKFDEFANPSFEQELLSLGNARVNGNISTERYVDMLWGDKLSKEDKAKEIAFIDEFNQRDTFNIGVDNEPTPSDFTDIPTATE